MSGYNYSQYTNIVVTAKDDDLIANVQISRGNSEHYHFNTVNNKNAVLAGIWYILGKAAHSDGSFTYMQGFWEKLVLDKTSRVIKHPRELCDTVFLDGKDINCHNGVVVLREMRENEIHEHQAYLGGLDGMQSLIWKGIL